MQPDEGLSLIWLLTPPRRHGNKYIPSVVRVGLSVHHSVRSVSLDALVEQRTRSAKVRPPCASCLHSAQRRAMHVMARSASMRTEPCRCGREKTSRGFQAAAPCTSQSKPRVRTRWSA